MDALDRIDDPELLRKHVRLAILERYGSRSVRGTEVAASSYSLIKTCILCGVDPEAYPRFVTHAALRQPGTAVLPHEFARGLRAAGIRAADRPPLRKTFIGGPNVMDRNWIKVRYTTNLVENNEEGWIALTLVEHTDDKSQVVARIIFWDAEGHFYLETSGRELPLVIVEELIGEARGRLCTK